MVGRLTSKAVPVLRQDHRNAVRGHQVPHAVHTWPLQACPALSGVGYLLEDLVALPGGVLTQGSYLLGEGISAPGLLVGGEAGVEDGPLGAVAVGTGHDYSPRSSVGSTSKALASLRIVLMCGSAWSRSMLTIVLGLTPAFSASSS